MFTCTVKAKLRDELWQLTCRTKQAAINLGQSLNGSFLVTLRCLLDGLLLPAGLEAGVPPLVAVDGDESFRLEAVEALYYELVEATEQERQLVQRYYRLLKVAADYRPVAA
jgi:hypothetical protein